jgi:ADP-ribose pyrophosphatase YjhB (NUDIX family)
MLEPGEDILTCARRELLKESGLTAGDLSLVGVYTGPQYAAIYPNGDQVQQYTICLQGTVKGGKMQVDGIETSEQRFFEPGEIPFEQLPPRYEAMIQDALSAGETAAQGYP